MLLGYVQVDKAQLDLAKGAKKKSFYGYINPKRKVQESIPPLVSSTGRQVTMDKVKVEVFNNCLCLSLRFASLSSSHTPQADGSEGEGYGSNVPPSVIDDQFHDHLSNLNI